MSGVTINPPTSRGRFYDYEKEEAIVRYKKAIGILIIAFAFGFIAGLLLDRALGGQIFLQPDIFIVKIKRPCVILSGVKASLLSIIGTMCLVPCVRKEKIARLKPWVCLALLLISLIPFLAT